LALCVLTDHQVGQSAKPRGVTVSVVKSVVKSVLKNMNRDTLNPSMVPTMSVDTLPESVASSVNTLARYELAVPALLFLAGHRPLAFVAGQMLHALTPLGGLLGIDAMDDWAYLLSDPDGAAVLMEALDHVA
jgi:hypothetical protein